MSITAYVLIHTEMGEAGDTVKEIAEIGGVVKAQNVTGQFDAVAIIEAENMDELGKITANKIQKVPGVIGTITCPAVDLG